MVTDSLGDSALMADVAAQMKILTERLDLGGPSGGRVVQFVGAARGAGTSGVARAFALEAARTAVRGVWLVELDLLRGAQHAFFDAHQAVYGALGPAVRPSPGEAVFFAVTPRAAGPDGKGRPDVGYLAAQPIGGRRLFITRFRREALVSGQTVAILSEPSYWSALRAHADLVVVDAPCLQRSAAATAVAPFMDDTVLVVAGDDRNLEDSRRLRDRLSEAGGRCAGVVMTRAPPAAPEFLRRLGL